jgi:hypothetical protein
VNVLAEYADAISGQIYKPRDYLEHMLKLTDDEKKQRQIFFEELFAKAEREQDE